MPDSPSAADPALRGPHPVGVRQTEIASPDDPVDPTRRLPCEIWYPARADAIDADSAPHPFGRPHRATPDLAPLDRACPLIAFSHGNSGLRQQSTFLTTHLASWGFVVVAPDHVGNTFPEMLEIQDDDTRREVHLRARRQRPVDLTRVIAALADDAHEASARPPVDAAAVGVMGHSYGGWTAIKSPRVDPRVGAVCALAPASEPFVGRRAFEEGELPLADSVATLVIAAEDDVLVDLDTSVRPLHTRLGDAAKLALLDRADHYHFCDGIEMLHGVHVKTPRPGLPRPPRPLAELRSEDDTHAWLCERVTRFFLHTLTGENR